MLLKGSCHCGAIEFEVESAQPCPYNLCYCSICRKTAGGGGFAINLGADHTSLKVRGNEDTGIYHAIIDGQESPAQRHFCRRCASALWVYDPRWPELVHPFASAIDSELPIPPERTHLMLGSKANWVEPALGPDDRCFAEYPEESLAEWHRRLELTSPDDVKS
jgi:hypothetical protein